MRNRTYGGVRGRKTKVGRKLLRFPPTRLPARGKGLTRFSDALLFLSVSRGREKRKKQKETPRPTGFLAKLHTHFLANLRGKTDK